MPPPRLASRREFGPRSNLMSKILPLRSLTLGVLIAVALAACATPARMHREAQLNDVALGCGLALGELIQDESEKRLVLLVHDNPSPQQRVCVAEWARKNGLKAVFLNMTFPAG